MYILHAVWLQVKQSEGYQNTRKTLLKNEEKYYFYFVVIFEQHCILIHFWNFPPYVGPFLKVHCLLQKFLCTFIYCNTFTHQKKERKAFESQCDFDLNNNPSRVECPRLWRITKNSLHNEGTYIYKWVNWVPIFFSYELLPTTSGPKKFPKIRVLKVNYFQLPMHLTNE